MTFIFDLDGTLSAAPHVFGNLMVSLIKGGHKVVVLTGAIQGIEITLEQRLQQLAGYDLYEDIHFNDLVIAVGRDIKEVATEKGNYCKAVGADMVFEDNEDYIRFIKAVSPSTTCLLMRP